MGKMGTVQSNDLRRPLLLKVRNIPISFIDSSKGRLKGRPFLLPKTKLTHGSYMSEIRNLNEKQIKNLICVNVRIA